MPKNTKNTEETASIDVCFANLIKKRGWWKSETIKEDDSYRKLAFKHKKMFLEGKLSYELKIKYLQAAGFERSQPELWRKTISSHDNKKSI